MPDMIHAYEGLQQSVGPFGSKGGLPVACCSAEAGLGCSWEDKGAQDSKKGNGHWVSYCEGIQQYVQRVYESNNRAQLG